MRKKVLNRTITFGLTLMNHIYTICERSIINGKQKFLIMRSKIDSDFQLADN